MELRRSWTRTRRRCSRGSPSSPAASTLDDLEFVAGSGASEPLAALVEASLVRRRGERFTLLETIREYALARLAERGGLEDARRRHLARYLEVAETAWEGILAGGDAEVEGMRLQDLEAANLRAAAAFATESGDGEALVRLAVAQRWFWIVRGRFAEARATSDAAVAADVGPLLHAAALNAAATFAKHQGEIGRAREQWSDALAIYRAHGDDGEAARCVAELGGVAVSEGDLETAHALYEECAVLFRELGNRAREGVAISNLSAIADHRGDLEASVVYGERAIELQRELDDRLNLAVSLANLAPTLLQLGEVERGRELLREAIAIGQEYGYTLLHSHALAVIAELAAIEGDAALAARFIGATESAFAAIGGEVPEGERRAFVRIAARLRASDEEIAGWREEGRGWSLEAALDAAQPFLA